jgi:hypothetical protein
MPSISTHPGALTSISQRQFWTRTNLARYGDGTVKGILSVDISEWEAPGVVYGKPAMRCTAEEIKNEVWAQLKQHLNDGGSMPIDEFRIRSEILISYFSILNSVRRPQAHRPRPKGSSCSVPRGRRP